MAPVLLVAIVLGAAAALPSGATESHTIARWEMDEPSGATVLVDRGSQHLDGQIGASVLTGVNEQGAIAHRFSVVAPDTSPFDPGRLLLVPHDPRLDPGDGDYAVTVRLRTTAPQGNIVQKGQALTTGGYFKIDSDDGRVACLFSGADGSARVRSSERIDDGTWKEIRCVRTVDAVALSINGVVVDRRRGATGVIANTWPLTIAGKASCNQVSVGCDYYSGDIDRVVLDRNTAATVPTTLAPSTSVEPTTTVAPTTSTTTTTVRPTTTTTTVPSTVVK